MNNPFFKFIGVLLLTIPLGYVYAAEMQVEINGIDNPLKKNVRLSLDWHGINVDSLTAAYLEQRLKQSEKHVHTALQPFGYYNASVSSQLQQQDDKWLAQYQVSAGPATKISTLALHFAGDGASDPSLKSATENFPLAVGSTLNHSLYEQGKSAINRQLSAAGYLNATLEAAKVRVHKARNQADIHLRWQTGKAYRFGTLSTDTNQFDPRLLSRWANFSAGQRFNYETLLSFQRRLAASGFFQRADVAIDADSENGIANVIVETEAAAKRLYSGSIGFGTDTGARAQLGFEQRWLNRFGHSFRSGIRLAELEQSYSLSYHVPALRGRADNYTYSWQRSNKQLPEYDSSSDRLSAVQLSNTAHWQILWGINLEHDSFIIGGNRQADTLWYLENQWSKYKSKQPVYPSHARSLIINTRLGAGFDGEQKYFSRLLIQQHWIRPAPWRGRIQVRGAIGSLWSDSFDRLPPQHRFYSGGDRNVRGYAYQSLSPVDANNDRIGGRHLAEASVELDYRLNDSWAVASFVDAGQAFSSQQPDIAIGTGIGLRFITSLLVIRVDVANAINQPNRPWRLHLNLGTSF